MVRFEQNEKDFTPSGTAFGDDNQSPDTQAALGGTGGGKQRESGQQGSTAASARPLRECRILASVPTELFDFGTLRASKVVTTRQLFLREKVSPVLPAGTTFAHFSQNRCFDSSFPENRQGKTA